MSTRLSLSEIVALLLTKGSEHDSVTLKLNAKGETQPEVTARSRDTETLAETSERATAVYDALCEKYRLPERDDNGAGEPEVERLARKAAAIARKSSHVE